MGVSIKTTSGPAIEKQGDLASILTNLKENDILFIDEIHRLKTQIEEILYSAMEDYKVDIVTGTGPGARTITLPLARFTLVGATTRFGLLTAPMRARFGIVQRLNFYPADELATIVRRSAVIMGIEATDDGAKEIAKRSRGTPRVANRLLRRVRDYADVKADGIITSEVAHDALLMLDVDEYGLDEMDTRVLKTLIEKFEGGPVGLSSLAVAMGEDATTLEEVYEPFLIQEGYLSRTPKGRSHSRSRRRPGAAVWPPFGARPARPGSPRRWPLRSTRAHRQERGSQTWVRCVPAGRGAQSGVS